MPHQKKNTILFLNENPLPQQFTKGTVSGKELRLRAALPQIDAVHVISRPGVPVQLDNRSRGEVEKKIHIHLLPPWPQYLSTVPLFFVGFYWIFRLKPVSIEAETPLFSGMAAILLGILFRTPTVIEIRSSFSKLSQFKFKYLPNKLKKILVGKVEKWTVAKSSCVIANSRHLKEIFKSVNSNIYEINPGIQYPPEKSEHGSKKNLSIAFIGRLVEEKRVDLLLQALSTISKKDDIIVHTIISGSGPEEKNLKNLVKALNLRNVTFAGIQNPYKILQKSDILVNPLTVDAPLEMVNAEAAQMGIPVICFGQNSIPETVVHNVTGIKVFPKTSEELAKAIILLLKDPSKLSLYSQNATKFAHANYSFTNQVKKMNKAYLSIGIS